MIGWGAAIGYLLPFLQATPLDAVDVVELAAAVCVPPALIGILYLLALRSSAAEARRFGATARAMRAEAASLEATVAALARRIEANRALLAEQAGVLGAIGDSAGERVTALAQTMGQQARTVDASTRALEQAVAEAEKRVGVVLASLPRANEELREVASRADAAGLAAGERAASLDAQLTALAERGREADAVAGGAAEKLAAHIARMEATSETAATRLVQVTGEMSTAVDAVLDRAANAVDEARKGIAAQGEAMLAMLGANQAALDPRRRDQVDRLGTSIASIEEAVGRISKQLGTERERGDALVKAISDGITTADREFSVMHAAGMDRNPGARRGAQRADAVGRGDERGDAQRRRHRTRRDQHLEDLLTALDASTREMTRRCPRRSTGSMRGSPRAARSSPIRSPSCSHWSPPPRARTTRSRRSPTSSASSATRSPRPRPRCSRRWRAGARRPMRSKASSTMRSRPRGASPRRRRRSSSMRCCACATRPPRPRSMRARRWRRSSPMPRGRSRRPAARRWRGAVEASVRRQLVELAESTEDAVTAATRASERLTQQMLALAETTAAVDRQIDAARAEHEKSDSDNFARRVSLLIEALNSASIDITKAFSAEVTDSAWTAYLKGDRGVFTRRAVRLLDAGEAREIAKLYQDAEVFRDNVNRYIHDFEAMLRQILALRDGSPLGVTLLSSDMGKLYVALAQAIERLRT
ncbi:MAG: hypothetical protein WDN24_03395 [Sphingomonas sp.]